MILFVFLALGCGRLENTESDTTNTETSKSVFPINNSNSEMQLFVIADSISIYVPTNWVKVDGYEVFAIKANCNKPFCENLAVTLLDDADRFTKMELAEMFHEQSLKSFNNFKLINSKAENIDSTELSFDYTLTANSLNLGGTTYMFIRGKKAVVFTFMGYNGENGEYHVIRKVISEILKSVSFKG